MAETATGAAYLKQCCRLLSTYNVFEMLFEYDGSGDSGDFNAIAVYVSADADSVGKQVENSGPLNSNTIFTITRPKRVSWSDFIEARRREKNPVITPEMCHQIENEAFDLLPCGWEINDGSYGSIIIRVTSETITLEHNERYTEVRTETQTF